MSVPLIERIIFRSEECDLLGGLVWRAPSAGQSRVRALREAKALMPDASHYVQAKVGEHVRYGVYQPRASEEGMTLPKGTLAAAVCFSGLVGDESRNAALVLTVPANSHRREERFLVVCLEDGVPVVDVLSNETESRNALGVEDRPIWSDNPVAYPSCRPASFEWLISGAQRPCRLTRIPPNPWPVVVATCTVASIAGGWWGVEHVDSARRAREDAESAKAADPVPKYLSALQSMRPGMAADRAGVLDAVRGMFASPLAVPGWMLGAAECSAVRHLCSRQWIRMGGTFADLQRALPGDDLELPASRTAGAPLFDFATTSRHWDLSRHALGDESHPLQSANVEFAAAAPLLQVWRTADIVLDFKLPTLWPRTGDVPTSFRHPRAVVAGDVAMRDVPGPFILEAVRDAPEFISWEDVKVDIDHGSAAAGALRFSASGVFYALQ
jgi:hypothetical protein